MSHTDLNEQKRSDSAATWSHIIPFGAWLYLMWFLEPPSGLNYAIRTAISLAFFLYLRPWRWYTGLKIRHLPLSLGAGVLVAVIWVFPEAPWLEGTAFQKGYLLVGYMPPWNLPEFPETSPYAPAVCGWPLVLVRLAGSALVISCIEEFFWRGFLYRWMQGTRFLDVDPGVLHLSSFLLVALVFGLEHNRWIAGFAAGIIYGWVLIRTRDIWAACIAHAVTNFLLGLYVLRIGAYQFW